MKLLRCGPPGRERPAVLDKLGRLRDLSGLIADLDPRTLIPDTLDRLSAIDPNSLPELPPGLRIGPCVSGVGKIICVGLNYRDHAEESKITPPSEPELFMKATSAIIGPDDDVEIPRGSQKTDWEVELGVVIGKPGKYIADERAAEHIAGYCIVNDLSERSYQLERGRQWDKGKGCDTFAPLGPWLVTRDEIPDPQNLDLWLEVDDNRLQQSNTRNMIFDVHYLISYISQFMSLRPGDVISTGTPAGVGFGQTPPRYLRPGQTVRLGITGLGIQMQRSVPG